MAFLSPYLKILERFRKPVLLGLDFGTSAVKLVRLEKKGLSFQVSRWIFPGAVDENDQSSVGQFRDFLKLNRLAGLHAACNVDDPSLRIRRLDIPKMPDFDLHEAVRWQLREVVDGPMENHVVRYTRLDEYKIGDTSRLALQAFAILRGVVRRRYQLLKRVALNPRLIEPTAVALLAAMDRVLTWPPDRYFAVLDLGVAHAGFFVVGEGKLYFSRPLKEADIRSFEKLKTEEGEGSSLEQLLPPFYSRVSIEVQRSMDAFALVFKGKKVESLFLCGGGAKQPHIAESLAKNLGMKVEIFNPFAGWPLEDEMAVQYAVATGLALYSS